MGKIVKSYRGVDEELVKEVQHLAIDEERTEADLINEALMILLRTYKERNDKLKKTNSAKKKK